MKEEDNTYLGLAYDGTMAQGIIEHGIKNMMASLGTNGWGATKEI